VPDTVALRRLVRRLRDLRAQEGADADALAVRGGAGEVEGRGQNRQADERDQEGGAGRDERGEDGETDGGDDEIEEEVEGSR